MGWGEWAGVKGKGEGMGGRYKVAKVEIPNIKFLVLCMSLLNFYSLARRLSLDIHIGHLVS